MHRLLLLTLSACGYFASSGADSLEANDAGSPDEPGVAQCGLAVTASHPSGPNPTGVVVADLNADSQIDIVIPSEQNVVPVLYGTTNGSWLKQDVQAGVRPVALAVADFNEDGRLDMAVSNAAPDPTASPTVAVLQGGSGGTFSPLSQTLTSSPYHLVAADFDGDGHQDVLVSSESGIRVFPGTGTGTFAMAAPELITGKTPTFDVADVDGDGQLDVIAISAWKLAVRASSTGTTKLYETGGLYPRDLAIGDLDADSDVDIAVVNGDDDTVRLFFNTAGSFETRIDLPTDVPFGSDEAGTGSGSNLGAWVPWNIAIGDFTADGRNDVLVLIQPYLPVENESRLLVLDRSGNKSFQVKQCAMETRPVDVVVGDFVGDSRTDAIIVAAPYDAGTGGKVMIVQQAP